MPARRLRSTGRAQRGVSLVEALVAITVLMFGTLALGRFQANALIQGHESQMRAMAARLADELLARGIADPAGADCYTVPAAGACASTGARAETDAWAARASAALATPATVLASHDAALGRLSVSLTWSDRERGPAHQLTMVTDVHP